jgi:hypothetical protein
LNRTSFDKSVAGPLATKFLLQKLVDHLGIGFAPSGFHHLTDKETDRLLLPIAIILCGSRIFFDDLIDD